jgi:hypothetical protein
MFCIAGTSTKLEIYAPDPVDEVLINVPDELVMLAVNPDTLDK